MVVFAGTLAADDDPFGLSEPPVRLKKKVKPQPDDKSPPPSPKEEPKPTQTEQPKRDERKGDAEPSAQDLQEQMAEITNRISKNMGQAEERLHKNDPGETTQQTQGDIVRDLDKLIEQTSRRQQQSSSSSSSSSQRDRQARRNRARQDPASNMQETPQNDLGGMSPRGGKNSQDGMSTIADLYKDVWGHLPETMRQEMNQYSREQFMAKYADLLKQYYATIAEKGRHKDER
jgi:hypothetical protein